MMHGPTNIKFEKNGYQIYCIYVNFRIYIRIRTLLEHHKNHQYRHYIIQYFQFDTLYAIQYIGIFHVSDHSETLENRQRNLIKSRIDYCDKTFSNLLKSYWNNFMNTFHEYITLCKLI